MTDEHADSLDRSSMPTSDQWVDLDPELVGQTLRDFNIPASQEETRSRIALNFTYVFLALITLCLIVPFVIYMAFPNQFPDPITNAKELVTLLASVLAGPFGFIVGFYFKQSQDNNNG